MTLHQILYRSVLVLLLGVFSSFSFGHALAPSLLEIKALEAEDEEVRAQEIDVQKIEVQKNSYDVLWKTPKKKEIGIYLVPRLPTVCGKPIDLKTREEGTGYVVSYIVSCSKPIEGQTLRIEDLKFATSNVVVRYIDKAGFKYHWLLSSDKTQVQVPLQKSSSTVFADYLKLGIEHLLGGIDHVVFVVALLLLVPVGKTLVVAITAFTLGHSITLVLSALDLLSIPQQPIEILIAVTIMLVASDVIRARTQVKATWLQRYPGMMTCLFGLIHGLGFAGVLSDIGLPVVDKVMALFAFNVGIELAQLGIVLIWLVSATLLTTVVVNMTTKFRAVESPWAGFQRWQQLMAYSIGSVGAYWVFDRSFSLIGF